MKIFKLFFWILSAIVITSCNRDSYSSNSSITIKYEVISTSSFQPLNLAGETFPSLVVHYINELGIIQTDPLKIGGTSWSKEIKLTTPQRPIAVTFSAGGYTKNTSGTVTIKVYINGQLKGSYNANIYSSYMGYGIFSGTIYNVMIQ